MSQLIEEHSMSPNATTTSNGVKHSDVVSSSTTHDPPNASRRQVYWWTIQLVFVLVIPVFLETLDYTVVATSQSHIASALHRLDLQSYIGTAYLLTSTVFLPLFGSLSDAFGRHWALQLSLLFFLIGSALSTGSHNMAAMLAGRGIAGIGAAGLFTVVRTILADTRSLDVNYLQVAMLIILYSVGFSVGPVIGGALVNISFRWVFAINLPCCVVSMVLVFLILRNKTRKPFCENATVTVTIVDKLLHVDWIAAVFFTGGGILFLLGLDWGSRLGWASAKTIVSLVVGSLLIIVALGWEAILEHKQRLALISIDLSESASKAMNEDAIKNECALTVSQSRNLPPLFRASSLLPLKMLANYDVAATNLAAFTSGMVMLVFFYFVGVFMVIVSGKDAVSAGTQLIFFAPGMGAGTLIQLRMIKRLRQPKYPIILGGIIMTVALGLVSMGINSSNQGEINGFMVMAGVGVGMTFGPLEIHARFSQPEGRVAAVIAFNLFFRLLGGTVGLAQCGAVLDTKVRSALSTLPPSTFGSSSGSSVTVSDLSTLAQLAALPPDIQVFVRDAFHNGVRWSFISLIPWAGLSAIACFHLREIVEDHNQPAAAEEHPMRTIENG